MMTHHPRRHWGQRIALAAIAFGALLAGAARKSDRDVPISFNRDIRPILSDTCFKCHGPDEKARKADLRLDRREGALADRDGSVAIVPGDTKASELVRRITHADPDERMPPTDSGRSLTAAQIDLLTRWVRQGAEYEPHWSFIPASRPAIPRVKDETWPHNPIDSFILARLEQEGLHPSPESDRRRLIRRVTLDLTGLPPTLSEVQGFVADRSPDAYEKVVDRLLDSPRYGERVATPWLDAARYADTQGYLFDTERYQWRWRDWAIAAFNRNQPFDRFTVDQLAGDMLPDATLDQKIASGFNRNHIINTEFGAIQQEYLVENIFDRVETTAMAWMGLTMQCARCHDHKYDPITQREYYQLYAFFNNVPEVGVDAINRNTDPLVQAPTDAQLRAIAELKAQVAGIEVRFKELEPKLTAAQAQWESQFHQPLEPVTDRLFAHWTFDGQTRGGAGHPDAKPEGGAIKFAPGLIGQALSLNGLNSLNAGNTADFDRDEPMTLAAWVRMDSSQGTQTLFSRVQTEAPFRGYVMQVANESLQVAWVHEYSNNMLRVVSKPWVKPGQWRHLAATYDGSGKAAGVKLYLDGRPLEVQETADLLTGTTRNERPFLIGSGPTGPFKGLIDEARVYSRALTEAEVARLPGVSLQTFLAIAPKERTEDQARRVREGYLDQYAPPEWKETYERVNELRHRHDAFLRDTPTVMVMREMDQPRNTVMLTRGDYQKPGKKVAAATPSALPAMPADLPRNRIGLARWLTDSSHPLTARVAVNRYWQMHFGTGLVKTAEDFGFQGEPPSHPQLLDWLATEFIRTGWDVKSLQRLIVTSAAYRQSAAVNEQLLDRDPENRLLARGPRGRLDAEAIRDQALAVSGLLVGPIGGPSVKPYEPAELWREVAFDTSGVALTGQLYVQDQGSSLYRRGLYTFWKRNSPPASLQTFDAPDRERCTVRRERTNTPLQALVAMNDPTYVEAARRFAQRMMTESGPTPADRIDWAYRTLLARSPMTRERKPLLAFFEEQQARFTRDTSAAQSLLGVGQSPRDPTLDSAQLAAYTVIANLLLNLDEALTRG